MTAFATADLYDEHPDSVQVAKPAFNDYGGNRRFCGPISTVKVFEDNSLVRTALQEGGMGRVLVVDGGGSLRCALVGDMLAQLGRDNGWTGIIISGCIRDSAVIAGIDIGVKALNTSPKKSVKNNVGERDIVVSFANVSFVPGEFVYADEDGILLSYKKLIEVTSD
ncbi:MAG: ribonuclease E activity regulator RraA [Gammaproteobacteria bacterium]